MSGQRAIVVFDPGELPHVPSMELRQQVVKAVACGVSEAGIAFLIGVDLLTLHRHYRNELTHGLDYFKAKVGSQLLDSCDRGDVNAQRFYLERMAGWAPPEKAAGKDEAAKVEHEERKRLMDSIVATIKPKADASQQRAKQGAGSKPRDSGTAGGLPPASSPLH